MPKGKETSKKPLTLLDMQAPRSAEAEDAQISIEAQIETKISLLNHAFDTGNDSVRAEFNRAQLSETLLSYNEANRDIDALSLLTQMVAIAEDYDDTKRNIMKLLIENLNQDAKNTKNFNTLAKRATRENITNDIRDEIQNTSYRNDSMYHQAMIISGVVGGLLAIVIARVPVAGVFGAALSAGVAWTFGESIIDSRLRKKQLKTLDDQVTKRLETYQENVDSHETQNMAYKKEYVFPAIKSMMGLK